MATPKDHVVASRRIRFSRGGVAKTFTVKIGVPKRVSTGEWACPYWITGLEDRGAFTARGVDAVQALVLALEGVRMKLAEQGGRNTWEGGTGSGFPRYVPDYLGRAFSEKVEAVVDREILRFARAAEAKHRRKQSTE